MRFRKAAPDKAKVKELLSIVHLEEFAKRRPHELSGGMQQRAALARALAQDADILLMDEPFGALDAMTRTVLHDELERIWQATGVSIVFVTHDVREAVRLGDRVILLSSRPGPSGGRGSSSPGTTPTPRLGECQRHRPGSHRSAPPAGSPSCRDRTNLLLEEDIRGLDRLELPMALADHRWTARSWRVAWPKLLAAAIVVALWQVVFWPGWKPPYVLPSPARVFSELGATGHDGALLARRGDHDAKGGGRICRRRSHRHRGRFGGLAEQCPSGVRSDH